MSPAERPGFRRVGERQRYDAGFFQVVTGTFVDPQGFTFERELLRHPGAVCVVALEDDGRHILCVRQYRAVIDDEVLELPAGKRDLPGEEPELCARRELVEEVGREAARFTELGRFYNSVGFSDEETYCFLAEGLTETARDAHGVEEQHMTIERVELAAVGAMVAAGEIVDAKTIIGCSLASRLLAGREGATAPGAAPAAQAAQAAAPATPPAAPAPAS
ncbi:MAG TPA: NUDIX hydrolase [Acidimicrobiales bacterium]|nr:NUDIX hydrolase [Acidimicrobiales bacterium]